MDHTPNFDNLEPHSLGSSARKQPYNEPFYLDCRTGVILISSDGQRINFSDILSQILRLEETQSQLQPNLLMQQMSHQKVMQERMDLIDKRMEQLTKRIDQIESAIGTQCRTPLLNPKIARLSAVTREQQQDEQKPGEFPLSKPSAAPKFYPIKRTTTNTDTTSKASKRWTSSVNSNIEPPAIFPEYEDFVTEGEEGFSIFIQDRDPLGVDDQKLELNLEEVQSPLRSKEVENVNTSSFDPLQCKFCPPSPDLIFEDAESLANHYTSEHPVPLNCPNADKNVFKLKKPAPTQPLRKVQTGVKNGGMCSECGKYYANISFHRQTHKPDAERRRYFCKTCGSGFVSDNYLRVHERTHTGERPFPCQYCDKSFARAGTLKIHTFLHTGERPFPCKHCGKTFNHPQSARSHESTCTHNGDNGNPNQRQRSKESPGPSSPRNRINTKAEPTDPEVLENFSLVWETEESKSDHFQTFPKVEIIETLPDDTEAR